MGIVGATAAEIAALNLRPDMSSRAVFFRIEKEAVAADRKSAENGYFESLRNLSGKNFAARTIVYRPEGRLLDPKMIEAALSDAQDKVFYTRVLQFLSGFKGDELRDILKGLSLDALEPAEVEKAIDAVLSGEEVRYDGPPFSTVSGGSQPVSASRVQSVPAPHGMVLDAGMIEEINSSPKRELFWKVVGRIKDLNLEIIGPESSSALLPEEIRKNSPNVHFHDSRQKALQALAANNIASANVSVAFRKKSDHLPQTLRQEIAGSGLSDSKFVVIADGAYTDPVVLLDGFFSGENVWVGAQDSSFMSELGKLLSKSIRRITSLDIDRVIQLASHMAQEIAQAA